MRRSAAVPNEMLVRFNAECERRGMNTGEAVSRYNDGMAQCAKHDREGRALRTLQWALSYLTDGTQHKDVDARNLVMLWADRGTHTASDWVKGRELTPAHAVIRIVYGLAVMIEQDTNGPLGCWVGRAAEKEAMFEMFEATERGQAAPRDERASFLEAYGDAFTLLVMGEHPHAGEDDLRLRGYYFVANAPTERLRALIAFLDTLDSGCVPNIQYSEDYSMVGPKEEAAIQNILTDLTGLKERMDQRRAKHILDIPFQ